MKKYTLFSFVFVLFLACKKTETIVNQPISGSWKVATLDANDVSKFKGTLVIKAPEKTSNGTSGCNFFNADIKADTINRTVSFSPVITTKIGCQNDLAVFENDYYKVLQVIDAYEFENASLILKEKGKKRILLTK
jgi:heat shock protein HslJ